MHVDKFCSAIALWIPVLRILAFLRFSASFAQKVFKTSGRQIFMKIVEEVGRLIKEGKPLEALEFLKENSSDDVRSVIEELFKDPTKIKELEGTWRALVGLAFFSYNSMSLSEEPFDRESVVSCLISSVNAVKLSRELGLNYLVPKFLRIGAKSLIVMKMNDRAEKFYLEAEKIARELSDLEELAEVENDIALLYYSEKRYEEALPKIQISLEIREKIGNKEKLAECLINAGEIYRKVGDYALAEDSFKRAEEIYRELVNFDRSYKFDLAIALSNLGTFYKARRRYEEAERMLKETLDLFEELETKDKNFGQFVAASLKHYGDLKKEMGDYKEAEEYYKMSADKFKEVMYGRMKY
ncbi:MAG: hypothetical protein DRO98_04465 [Archaeoglobales archaeon]|nr:MAG: hypothetical protein DRO98_04465 [Archaeoglobales archaeon]